MSDARPVVVIDPGHGGNTKVGGSSPNNATGPNGLREKNLTLDLARRVRDRLASQARVMMTRDADTNLSLSARAQLARDNQAALFLSIHLNGFQDATVDGSEVWVARNANQTSQDFAQSLLSGLVAVTGVRDRGVRESDFGVLLPSRHASGTAASLVEVAFLTNPGQARRLEDDRYKQSLAEAMSEAIRQHLHATGAPRTLEHLPGHVVPDYSRVDSAAQALRIFADWLQRQLRFTLGVENPTFFPHSAICKLRITKNDGRVGLGSGFYIARNRILTVGHNLAFRGARAAQIEVFPGKAHNMSTFNSFRVSGAQNFITHPQYNPNAPVNQHFASFDLGVIKVEQPPPDNYFQIEELRMSPGGGIIVCGYAAEGVNPDQQRMDVDTIRDLDSESFTYALQIRRGSSGAPVFYIAGNQIRAVGIQSTTGGRHVNRGCRLTDAKIAWIRGI